MAVAKSSLVLWLLLAIPVAAQQARLPGEDAAVYPDAREGHLLWAGPWKTLADGTVVSATVPEAVACTYRLLVNALFSGPVTPSCRAVAPDALYKTPAFTECSAPFPASAKAQFKAGGTFVLSITTQCPGDFEGPPRPVDPTPFILPSTCPYAAPGVTTLTTVPIGTVKEGTNPVPQGVRIAQLEDWGFAVRTSMASPTTIHVIARCLGKLP